MTGWTAACKAKLKRLSLFKMPIFGKVILLLIIFLPFLCQANEKARQFHTPENSAEKALDETLKKSDSDTNLLDNLFNGRGNSNFSNTINYKNILTNALMHSLSQKEWELVKQNCNGKYIDDEICGFDFNPITCSQDNGDFEYIYRTKQQSENEAIIEFKGDKESNNITSIYKLKKLHTWKLDGIYCNNNKFNWGNDI